MRNTPKMSESPAATSHRYMASLSPTRPWKSRRRVMQVVLPLRLDGREWRLAVVLVGRGDPQIAEDGDGGLRVVADPTPGDRVHRLVVLLADLAGTGGAIEIEVFQRSDDLVDVEGTGLLHGLLDRVERRVGRLRDVARIRVPALAEA